MNPGIYKDTTGHFGYLSPNGIFTANISRSKARELAQESGFSTTLKGIYEPPIEKPVQKDKRTYRKLNFLELLNTTERGDILCEVSQEDFYVTYMAFLMTGKNHPEMKGKYLHTRNKATCGIIAKRKGYQEDIVIFVRW